MKVFLKTPFDIEYVTKVAKILASETCIRIVFLLQSGKKYNINDIAKSLNITHKWASLKTKDLRDIGVVEMKSLGEGKATLCSLADKKVIFDFSELK